MNQGLNLDIYLKGGIIKYTLRRSKLPNALELEDAEMNSVFQCRCPTKF